jgi:CheY-like chemotaxis protein
MTKNLVLVVEPDADIRQLLYDRLEQGGYEVVEAATGEAALAIAFTVDLNGVVLEITLPGLPGLGVLDQLHFTHRDDQHGTDLPTARPRSRSARILHQTLRPPPAPYVRAFFHEDWKWDPLSPTGQRQRAQCLSIDSLTRGG